MRRLLILVLFVVVAIPAVAQIETPRVSQNGSLTQTIGTTDITINYHRPGVKGRVIWGGLVPYDQPWRMGANEATTITFSDAVRIGETEVAAGTYSFFAIPSRETWTLILNKDPEQWGAYGYDPGKDALRIEVRPVEAPHTEWMRFTIDPTSPSSAAATLNWEKVAVTLPIEVDVDKVVWSQIDRSLASSYASAANFAIQTGERLDEGLVWIDRSIATGGESLFNLWSRAQLLQKLGRAGEAVPVMEKVLVLARENQIPDDFMNILNGSMASMRADAAKKR